MLKLGLHLTNFHLRVSHNLNLFSIQDFELFFLWIWLVPFGSKNISLSSLREAIPWSEVIITLVVSSRSAFINSLELMNNSIYNNTHFTYSTKYLTRPSNSSSLALTSFESGPFLGRLRVIKFFWTDFVNEVLKLKSYQTCNFQVASVFLII